MPTAIGGRSRASLEGRERVNCDSVYTPWTGVYISLSKCIESKEGSNGPGFAMESLSDVRPYDPGTLDELKALDYPTRPFKFVIQTTCGVCPYER
jgi:hypothetical protein